MIVLTWRVHTSLIAGSLEWILSHVPKGAAIDVAKDLDMDLRPLKDIYKAVLVDFRAASPQQLRGYVGKRKGHYVLVPRYRYEKRFPKQRAMAQDLNGRLDILRQDSVVMHEFGSRPLNVATSMLLA